MEIITMKMGDWQMLPPPKNCCQICGQEHDVEEPHDAQSLYYQTWFYETYKRQLTWNDALMHCPEPVKERWSYYLTALGIDLSSSEVASSLKSEEEVVEAIKEAHDSFPLKGQPRHLDQ